MEKQNLLNKSLFVFLISFLSLVLFLFLLNIFIRQYSDKSLWDISLAVFALLGVLLTAGAAFATVAAIISYLSINGKLQQAQSDLELAKIALEQFQNLNQKKKALEISIDELNNYQIIVDKLKNVKTIENNQDIIHSAEFVLAQENSLLQDKIRANAILYHIKGNDDNDNREFDSAIYNYKIATDCWRILFLSNPKDNIINYINSLFSLAYSKLESKKPLEFEDVEKIFHDVIYLAKNFRINNIIGAAYYNIACKYALEENVSKAIEFLKMSYKFDTVSKEHVEKDGTLDKIRLKKEFQEWFSENFR